MRTSLDPLLHSLRYYTMLDTGMQVRNEIATVKDDERSSGTDDAVDMICRVK